MYMGTDESASRTRVVSFVEQQDAVTSVTAAVARMLFDLDELE